MHALSLIMEDSNVIHDVQLSSKKSQLGFVEH